MSQIIHRGKELIRINPVNKKRIEVSINDGRSWALRSSINSTGDFLDLVDNGKEIIGLTDKGTYVSTNDGRSWFKRS